MQLLKATLLFVLSLGVLGGTTVTMLSGCFSTKLVPRAPATVAPATTATAAHGWAGLRLQNTAPAGPKTVAFVAPTGPAARAGVLVGDQLLTINGLATQAISTTAAQGLLMGPVGRQLSLIVMRPSTGETRTAVMLFENVAVTRRKIEAMRHRGDDAVAAPVETAPPPQANPVLY